MSKYRDGDDGPWSTFWVDIGTPWQSVKLLPSTSGNAIWPVLTEGCTPQDHRECPDQRGSIFKPNQSTTWQPIGLYRLVLAHERALGYDGNSSFGLDSIKFGLPKDDFPVITDQIVEGIATKDFYMGTIGLNSNPIYISSYNDQKASLLTNLKDQGKVPSRSWAYTAGAAYQQPSAFGSLTFGGFDITRFVPNNLSFPFGPESSRDLLLGLQSITTNISTTPLLSGGIFVFLDSLVPHLWLPPQVCEAFQNAFSLTYNASKNLYFVNETSHSRLVAQNPSVTLVLGQGVSGGEAVNVTMQYGSFDLIDYGDPYTQKGTRYFPLRQANDSDQYTLGRAFFQDAYVIADYERGNFSVSQAIFPSTSTRKKVLTIYPPSESKSESKSESHLPFLPKEDITAIVLALVVIMILMALAWWYFRLRKTKIQVKCRSTDQSLPTTACQTVCWDGKQYEVSADAQIKVPELPDCCVHEMRTEYNDGCELPITNSRARTSRIKIEPRS